MSKKGVSDYVSHILAIAIALVILGLIASSMYDYYTDLVVESQRSEAETLSENIGDSILRLYSRYNGHGTVPEEGENITLATAEVDTPDRVAGRNYDIYLNSSRAYWIDARLESASNISLIDAERPTAKIIVEVTDFPEKRYEYGLYNIEVDMKGRVSRPDGVVLRYMRENVGGNVIDTIKMSRSP